MAGWNFNNVWNHNFLGVPDDGSSGHSTDDCWSIFTPGEKHYEPSKQNGGSATGFPTDVVEFKFTPGQTSTYEWLLYGLLTGGPTPNRPGNNPVNQGDRIRFYMSAASSKLNAAGYPDIVGMTQPKLNAYEADADPAQAGGSGAPAATPIPWTDYPIVGSNNVRGQTTFPVMWEWLNNYNTQSDGFTFVVEGKWGQRSVVVVPYSMYIAIATSTEVMPPGPPANLVGTQVNNGVNVSMELSWSPPTLVDTAHGSIISGYNVYRSTFPAVSGVPNATPRTLVSAKQAGTTYTDPNLDPLNIYTYWVCAVEGKTPRPANMFPTLTDWEGCSAVWRANVEISPDDAAPTRPSRLRIELASKPTPPQAAQHLMWDAATDDDLTRPVGYYIYDENLSAIDGQPSGTPTRENAVPTTNLFYDLSSQEIGATEYTRWHVTPTDHTSKTAGYGTLPGSLWYRLGPDSEPLQINHGDGGYGSMNQFPTTPQNLRVVASSTAGITLQWDASTDEQGWPMWKASDGSPILDRGWHIQGYNIYRDGIPIKQAPLWPAAADPAPQNIFTDSTVVPETTYVYTVAGVDDGNKAGLQSTPVSAVATGAPPVDQPPTAPANLHQVSVTTSSAEIAWNPSTDDVAVAGYNVYRDTVLLNTIGPLTTTDFADPTLVTETTYSYTVTAVDNLGQESPPSAALSVTTAAVGADLPPSKPTALTTEGVLATRVMLTWATATDDAGVAGYNVYRDTVKRTTIPIASTKYTDTPLTPQTEYTYTITAMDTIGQESAPSDPITVITLAAPVGGGGDGGGIPGAPPTGLPWDMYAALADTLAPYVASHAGRVDENEHRNKAIAQAKAHIPTVATYVYGYTRGRGWNEDGSPVGPLCAVIVSASARLVTNPEQLFHYALGDYTERPAVLTGWTLTELAVLRRYRKIAA